MCALLLSLAASAATSAGEVYDEDVIPRRGKDFLGGGEFRKRHGGRPWEIKACFKHEDGHLGTFEVGDTVSVQFTVGIVGERWSANVKNFRAPAAAVYILNGRKVREVLSMKPGAC
jgi:hypothetical protein